MNADVFILDGHAYSWRRICELRRQQLEARAATRARQLALFALKHDRRPAAERTSAARYLEPSLLPLMQASPSTKQG